VRQTIEECNASRSEGMKKKFKKKLKNFFYSKKNLETSLNNKYVGCSSSKLASKIFIARIVQQYYLLKIN
jgi:hypothetical protein